MKYLIGCFLYISAFAIEPSSELLLQADQTNAEMSSFVAEFPYGKYEICQTKNGWQFYIDNRNDTVKGTLAEGRDWEPIIGILIQHFAKAGTVALDIGAHIGTQSLIMSRAVGPSGQVISFEPQLKIFRELYHNLSLNKCAHNTFLLRNAVGDKEQVVEMCAEGSGNEGGVGIGKGGDEARMITVDSLNLTNVSFIKMDIEGYEFPAIQGARNTIISSQPVIIFEALGLGLKNPSGGGIQSHAIALPSGSGEQNFNALMGFFDSLNYSVFRIDETNFIAFPFRKYTPQSRHHFLRPKYHRIKK